MDEIAKQFITILKVLALATAFGIALNSLQAGAAVFFAIYIMALLYAALSKL